MSAAYVNIAYPVPRLSVGCQYPLIVLNSANVTPDIVVFQATRRNGLVPTTRQIYLVLEVKPLSVSRSVVGGQYFSRAMMFVAQYEADQYTRRVIGYPAINNPARTIYAMAAVGQWYSWNMYSCQNGLWVRSGWSDLFDISVVPILTQILL